MAFLSGIAGALGGVGLGEAVVQVAVDTSALSSGLAKAHDEVAASTTSMGSAVKALGPAFAAAGIAAVGAFGASAIASFLEAEKVMAQTEAVVKSTGMAAGLSAVQVGDLAKAFEHTTTFSDEAVQSMENVLLTFTKVGHDIFPTATQAILDMSTALGTDLQGAAIQVGKALNDPITGMTALRRVGVSFSKAQIDQIQHLVDTNRLMEAQKVILGELSTEFGGSASKALDTYGGKWEQLMNRVDDFKENVGAGILELTSAFTDQDERQAAMVKNMETWLGRDYLAGQKGANALGLSFIGLALEEDALAIKTKALGEGLTNFAGMTADELESWQTSTVGSMGFVSAALDDLTSSAHVTAREILRSFESALGAQADFAKNSNSFLIEVQKNLGPGLATAAGEMVAALSEKGPQGAAIMEALSHTSDTMARNILRDWRASGQGAQSYVNELAAVDAHLAGLTDKKHVVNIEVITKYIDIGKI